MAVALRRLEAAGLLIWIRRRVGLIRYSNAYVFPKSEFRPQTTTYKKPNSLSARAVPAAESLPMAVVLARIRAELRADYEAIVRGRAVRQARQATTG